MIIAHSASDVANAVHANTPFIVHLLLADGDRANSLFTRSHICALLGQALPQQQWHITQGNTATGYPLCLAPIGWHISLSHSGNHIAALVCPATINALGIDIEHKTVPMRIAKRYFNTLEVAYLASLAAPAQQHALQSLWMLKECWVKAHQLTLLSSLKLNLLPLYQALPDNQCQAVTYDGKTYSVASHSSHGQPIIALYQQP